MRNVYFIFIVYVLDQIKSFAKPDMTLILRNVHTRVDRTGHIKLVADFWGKIEESKSFLIKQEIDKNNNISLPEYEAVHND